MSALDAVDAASEQVRKPGTFRVTADDLRARVATTEFIVRGVLTVALVQLDNGYWLVGKSAPVDPSNFNAEYGQELAFDDALRQAWPLVTFAHLDATQPACSCQSPDAEHRSGDEAFCGGDEQS